MNKTKDLLNKKFIYISLFLNILVGLIICLDKYSNILIFLWLASIILLLLSSINSLPSEKSRLSVKTLFVSLLIALPVLVRIINFNPARVHGDEFIVAYYSAHYDFQKDNFFCPVRDMGDWTNQFPNVYFALQKIFFSLAGENFITVKLSIIPWLLIISASLFFYTKNVFGEKIAVITIILYSFFAISLYHETLSLIINTGAPVFIIFLCCLNFYGKEEKVFYAICAGIFCSLCYLFYQTAYCALLFLFLFYLIEIIKKKRFKIFRDFLFSILAVLITFSPFLSYMVKSKNFYLTDRYCQVKIAGGTWGKVWKK